MASEAPELSYEQVYALGKEINKAFALKQEELRKVWAEHSGNKMQQQKARVVLMSPMQHEIIAKYGFEASFKGVLESTKAFRPWAHYHEIHENNCEMMYYWDPELANRFPTLDEYLAYCRKESPPPPPDKSAKVRPFTLSDAHLMQEDLIAGYSSDEYQSALRQEYIAAAGNATQFKIAVNDLNFRLVLTKVLEKYGFENSRKGAFASLQAFQPFNISDRTVMVNNVKLEYYNNPENQEISLEDFLEKRAKEHENATTAKADSKAAGYGSGKEPVIAGASSSPPALTKAQALEMQEELIAGYRSLDFQNSIRKAYDEAKASDEDVAKTQRTFMASRSNLLYEMVQQHALEKFGFEHSKRGLMQSVAAFQPFDGDPDVARNNAVMAYLTFPSLQDVSLDEFLASKSQA